MLALLEVSDLLTWPRLCHSMSFYWKNNIYFTSSLKHFKININKVDHWVGLSKMNQLYPSDLNSFWDDKMANNDVNVEYTEEYGVSVLSHEK